jgi:hypothetical protein
MGPGSSLTLRAFVALAFVRCRYEFPDLLFPLRGPPLTLQISRKNIWKAPQSW